MEAVTEPPASTPRAVPRPPVPHAPAVPAAPSGPAASSGPSGRSAGEPATDLGPEVTEALAALEHLESAPLAEHVDAFDTVHRLLQARLAEAED